MVVLSTKIFEFIFVFAVLSSAVFNRVQDGFHKCRYHYRIIVSTEALSIFERNRAWHIHEDLHIPVMQVQNASFYCLFFKFTMYFS